MYYHERCAHMILIPRLAVWADRWEPIGAGKDMHLQPKVNEDIDHKPGVSDTSRRSKVKG